MLSGTHLLAHRARLGLIRLNSAAGCFILVPSSRRHSSRSVAQPVAAAAAAPSPAAAATATSAASPAVQLQAPLPGLSFAERPGVWDADSKLQLKNLTFEELVEWCEAIGHDSRKALLLWKAIYQDGRWVRSITEHTTPPQPPPPAAAAAAAAAGEVLSLGYSSSSSRLGVSGLQLSSALQSTVQQHASLDGGLTLQSVTTARDGTHKLLFALTGGGSTAGSVETVLIPMRDRGGSRLRYTACLSSQVGCAMNCQFCYTGRMGLLGNLTTAQIVEQLVESRRWLEDYTAQQQQQQQQQLLLEPLLPLHQQHQHQHQQEESDMQQQQQQQHANVSQQQEQQPSSRGSRGIRKGSQGQQAPRINNIVFMGMGEPLHNPAVWPALDILCHPAGLALSRSKVIVSTVGLLPQLRALRASGKAKLAVSLHATTDEVRDWIVPTNRRYPLAELIGTLKELYPLSTNTDVVDSDSSSSSSDAAAADATTRSSDSSSSSSSKKRRRSAKSDDFVVIEYVLLKDVNDSDADAQRLLELLAEVYCMVNLIVFNPHEGTAFQKTDEEQAKRFQKILQAGGKVCTLRVSKGDDEMAACGQLGGASMGLASRPAPLLTPPQRLRDSLPGVAAAAAAMGRTGPGRARQLLLKKQQKFSGPAVVPR